MKLKDNGTLYTSLAVLNNSLFETAQAVGRSEIYLTEDQENRLQEQLTDVANRMNKFIRNIQLAGGYIDIT